MHEFHNRGGCFNKHFKACNGTYTLTKKLTNCKHCYLNFETLTNSERANHSRWCEKNPKKDSYRDLTKERSCKANFENQYTKAKKQGKTIPVSPLKGKPSSHIGRKHSEKTRALQREKALSSPHRRVMKKTALYNNIAMDSTWEIELAKRLDFLNIKWERPAPILWKDKNNVFHHYFADFYIPDYNLYLDPKNPLVCNLQQEKLICLAEQYNNIVIISSLEECKNYLPSDRSLVRIQSVAPLFE